MDKNQKKFEKALGRLILILKDHPVFNLKIDEIKDKAGIPLEGFDSAKYLVWKLDNKDNYQNALESINSLILMIRVPYLFRSFLHKIIEIRVFFTDFENEFKKESKQMPKSWNIKSGLNEYDHYGSESENFLFIQISPWTKKNELNKIWKEVTIIRKKNDLEIDRDKFFIPEINNLYRKVWLMRKEGMDYEMIKDKVSSIKKPLTRYDVSQYKSRYEQDTLNKVMLLK